MIISNSHVLVTGGAGFIGSHLVDRLVRKGAFVRVVDDLSTGSKDNIKEWLSSDKFELLVGDIRDPDLMSKAVQNIEYVFHQAAIVSVPLSVEDPRLVTDVNVMGTLNVLESCRIADVKRVVVTSSAAVYGEPKKMPISEDAPKQPLSPYGASKLAAEEITQSFHKTYGLSTTIIRPFNIYGPRQRGSAYAGVITVFLKNAHAGRPLQIDGDGQQTRDFVYVGDIVESNILAIMKQEADGQIYNIGSGEKITIKQLADLIIRVTGSKSPVTFGSPRKGDIRDSQASIEKAVRELGYSPQVPIAEGLALTAEWIASKSDD